MTEYRLVPRAWVPDHYHIVDAGDGVCGDCLWCEENVEDDCNVPDDPKCAWCGHCLGNHSEPDESKPKEASA